MSQFHIGPSLCRVWVKRNKYTDTLGYCVSIFVNTHFKSNLVNSSFSALKNSLHKPVEAQIWELCDKLQVFGGCHKHSLQHSQPDTQFILSTLINNTLTLLTTPFESRHRPLVICFYHHNRLPFIGCPFTMPISNQTWSILVSQH